MKSILFLTLVAFSAIIVVSADTENEVNIVPRAEWGAKAAKQGGKKLDQTPAPYVIIGHEGNGALVCKNKPKCIKHAQNMQAVNQQHSIDIYYNFLVGGDGNVYEGRGWDVAGAFAEGYNGKSIGIAFLGDFSYTEPPKEQIEAAKNFLEYAVKEGKITDTYKLLGERQVRTNTQSPGNKLYNKIKTWEHYSAKP